MEGTVGQGVVYGGVVVSISLIVESTRSESSLSDSEKNMTMITFLIISSSVSGIVSQSWCDHPR